jgi:uncharacterized protein YkwD
MAQTSMRRIAPFTILVPVLAFLALPASASAGCKGADRHPGDLSRKQAASSTLCLLNRERRAHGLRRLRSNGRLARAARRHARDMVRRHYFSHFSPSGASFMDRIRRTGYLSRARSWFAGENLAWGSRDRATPRAIVRSWMNSPPHRANILQGAFREIGVGVVPGSPRGRGAAATYVTEFGKRR